MILQRWWLLGLIWLTMSSIVAQAQSLPLLDSDYNLKDKGVLLQVTASVPVFLRADPKSARLANAEAGTVLLVIELSSKRSWVKVEDDQGTQGWVPVDRTDLKELLEAQVKIRQAELESARAQLEERAAAKSEDEDVSGESRYQSSNRITHVVGPAYEFLGGRAWGVLYSLLFEFQVPERRRIRQRAFGFEAAWFDLAPKNRYEFRGRYSSKLSGDAHFSYGPDVGVRFGSLQSPTVFVLGYRVGYDFAWRFPIEFRMGISTEARHRWLSELSWRVRF